MEVFSQPHSKNIGEKIQTLLELQGSDKFDTFYIMSAYVKKSGVIRLQPFIEKFRSSGGKVKAVIGIDQRLTSIQGLQLLLGLCDEIYVYHSESIMQTFHPKAYAFERNNTAVLIIGSSNMTSGGLYTNYELNAYYSYDLSKVSDKQKFADFKNTFTFYSTPSRCSKTLSPELLKKLIEDGTYLFDEDKDIKRVFSNKWEFESKHREKIFGMEIFRAPVIAGKQLSMEEAVKSMSRGKEIIDESLIIETETELPKGNLLWQKPLTNSDASQVQSGTQPVGGLRLTQAHWKVGGRPINQTTYFRHKIFGKFSWIQIRARPSYVEGARIPFSVSILGNDVGIHILTVRHKPSGEAGQGNYTTSISWGEISKQIRDANVSGKLLSLYAPPMDKEEPFFIEIR